MHSLKLARRITDALGLVLPDNTFVKTFETLTEQVYRKNIILIRNFVNIN